VTRFPGKSHSFNGNRVHLCTLSVIRIRGDSRSCGMHDVRQSRKEGRFRGACDCGSSQRTRKPKNSRKRDFMTALRIGESTGGDPDRNCEEMNNE